MARYLGSTSFELLDNLKRYLRDHGLEHELSGLIQNAKSHRRFYRFGVSPQQLAADEKLVDWVNEKIKTHYTNVENFYFKPKEADHLIYALDDKSKLKGLKSMVSLMPLRIALQPGLLRKIFLLGISVTMVLGSFALLNFLSIPLLSLSAAAVTYASAAAIGGSMLTCLFTYPFLTKIDKNIVIEYEKMQRLKSVDFELENDSPSEMRQALERQTSPDLNPQSSIISDAAPRNSHSSSSPSPMPESPRSPFSH